MAAEPLPVAGLGIDDNTATNPNPGVLSGKKFKVLGQTSNNSNGTVANQQIGSAPLASLAAGASGTVVVSNSLVTANSIILVSVSNEVAAGTFGGDVTAGKSVNAWIESVAAGTFTIGYHSAALMSGNWTAWFLIFN